MQSLVDPESKSEVEEPAVSLEELKDIDPRLVGDKDKNKPKHKVFKTDCNHLFHEQCLDEWLKIKEECPSCRRIVVDFI